MKAKETEFSGESAELIIAFKNKPTQKAPKVLFESLFLLEESKTKDWGNGYRYRLDRRPDHMGGDQVHVLGPRGQAWAYRYNGLKSEPHKYTSAATRIVKDIVADVFKIDKGKIEEAFILKADSDQMLVEVSFVV